MMTRTPPTTPPRKSAAGNVEAALGQKSNRTILTPFTEWKTTNAIRPSSTTRNSQRSGQ